MNFTDDARSVGRCQSNLGSAYYQMSDYPSSLLQHRSQLVSALQLHDPKMAAAALTSLGHVYARTGEPENALNSHKQCALLLKHLCSSHPAG